MPKGKSKRDYLKSVYRGMKSRCNGELDKSSGRSYTENMIFCLFESADAFIDYVLNVLKVDPRGKQIHRLDNDGHYAPGNVEFLTAGEHGKAHRGNRHAPCPKRIECQSYTPGMDENIKEKF
jgi:hypothetical protein